MKIEFDSIEDMKKFLDDLGFDIRPKEKRPMTNAEKQKAYRERKKMSDSNESVTDGNGMDGEKREEKEEVLPPSSPSSLPSSPSNSPINYPITPYNPPLPEEKGERKEREKTATAENRSELRLFGKFVRLTQKEYDNLVKDFGVAKTAEMIRKVDDYVGEDPKLIKKYQTRNHNLTIRNWIRRDEEKRTFQKQQPKEETFADIARELNGWDVEL